MDRLVARPVEVALLSLLVAVCAVRNLPWNLDDYDQAKQAFVSLEMVGAGEWWFQHTPSGKVATKPPLAGWISAALQPVVGWDLAWRLPSLLAAAGVAAVLWRSGGRVLPGAGGILAVCAFGFTLLTPRLATLVRTDMLLACWIFLAGWMVWDRLESGRRWTPGARWGLAGLVAAALLTKGPILYAFLLPALGCWPLLRRCGRVRSALGTGWWPWALPFLVFLAWVAAGIAQDPEFREQVVDREFLGRFTTGETAVHRSQPLWFYAVHLLHKLAPWSLLAAGLGWAVWRRARPGSRTGAGSPPEGLRDADRWLIALVAGGLVVMSFIPSKRVDRVFALVPSLALLIPCLVRAAGGWPPHRRLLAVCLAVAVVFSGGYAVVRPIRAVRADEGALARFGRETLALARAGGLRIGVVRSPREGVAAYLRDPRPVPAAEARRRWMQGALDGVLVLESDWKRGGWQPAGRVVGSVEIPDGRGATLFVLREESAGP